MRRRILMLLLLLVVLDAHGLGAQQGQQLDKPGLWQPPSRGLVCDGGPCIDDLPVPDARALEQKLGTIIDILRRAAPIAQPRGFEVSTSTQAHNSAHPDRKANIATLSVGFHYYNARGEPTPSEAAVSVVVNGFEMLWQEKPGWRDAEGELFALRPYLQVGTIGGWPVFSRNDRPTRPNLPTTAHYVVLTRAKEPLWVPVPVGRFLRADAARMREQLAEFERGYKRNEEEYFRTTGKRFSADNVARAEQTRDQFRRRIRILEDRLASLSAQQLAAPAHVRDTWGAYNDGDWTLPDPDAMAEPILTQNPKLWNPALPRNTFHVLVLSFEAHDMSLPPAQELIKGLMPAVDWSALSELLR